MVSSSTDHHSFSKSTTAQPEVAAARALTFAELQALVEQGKTDDIPNNKHIPDALNVGFKFLLSNLVRMFSVGRPTQSVKRTAAQKALGGHFTSK